MSRFPFAMLLIILTAAVALTAAPAAAQTTNAVIAGVVADAQGGVLPGVTLTARNAETGFTRTVVTEGDGRYRLAGLPPGRYDLRAELQGFGPAETATTGGCCRPSTSGERRGGSVRFRSRRLTPTTSTPSICVSVRHSLWAARRSSS